MGDITTPSGNDFIETLVQFRWLVLVIAFDYKEADFILTYNDLPYLG